MRLTCSSTNLPSLIAWFQTCVGYQHERHRAEGRPLAYIDDAPFVTREKEIAFQILVARPFIESACGDHIVGLVADVLIQDWISIKREEGHRSPTAEHDDAGDIVDAGTLLTVSCWYRGTRMPPHLYWLARCQDPNQLQPVEIPHQHFAVHGSG